MHGFTTRQLHADGRTKPMNAHAMPIFLTSTFAFDSPETGADLFLGRRAGHVYSRIGNPTVETVEQVAQIVDHRIPCSIPAGRATPSPIANP